MGSLSNTEKRKLAYFHALGKAMTENTQAVYESKYKSSHNVKIDEVWTDIVGYAETYTDAINEATSNSAVTHHNEVVLDEIFGSNGQSYAFISGGTFKDSSYPLQERGQLTSGATFIRPWISPVDIPESQSNKPSNGYTLRLFRGDNATNGTPGSEIYLTEGAWSVDYYAGIIHFAEGYTPSELGWGNIKATFFQYSGNMGVSGLEDKGFTLVEFNSGTTELVFDKGLSTEERVSLEKLKEVISHANINMTANNTNSGSTLATNTTITEQVVEGSGVRVYVNGIEVVNSIDCYFSPDLNGSTVRNVGEEKIGDYLHWMYSGINPVVGYHLSIVDKISFMYLTYK